MALVSAAIAVGGCCSPVRIPCATPPGPPPAPRPGRCSALAPPPEALLAPGDLGAGVSLLPDGRRIHPFGATFALGSFPAAIVRAGAAPYAVVLDTPFGAQAVHVVDVTTGLARSSAPVNDAFWGLALTADATRAYVATETEIVRFDIDAAGGLVGAGTIAADGGPAGLALSADEATLYVAAQIAGELRAFETATGRLVFAVGLGTDSEPLDVELRPDGAFAYVSLWAASSVVAVDLRGAAPAVTASFTVGKNPEALAASPDGSTLFAAGADSDTVSVIDLGGGALMDTIDLRGDASAPAGSSPTTLALSADGRRLYVTSALDNAVDVVDVATRTRIGRIATGAYPSGIAVGPDGLVAVTNARGAGPGANLGGVFPGYLVRGSLSLFAEPSVAELPALSVDVETNNRRAGLSAASVGCTDNPYDFPVPRVAGEASPIEHVVLVVRENKTYDAVLGDLAGTRADPSLVLFGEDVTPNLHALARGFANLDNFFVPAEASLQGHLWTTSGRTNDYVERTWIATRRSGRRPERQGRTEVGLPEGGSFFDHLDRHGVSFAVYGEEWGMTPATLRYRDPGFPGVGFDLSIRDVDKARYVAERLRCNFPAFVYVLLPNDHTVGTVPGWPTPESMVADNDEATGLLVESIAAGPYWPRTLIFIVEDDPQVGADHIGVHRTVGVLVSPWVRRAVTSSVLYDLPSFFRTIELVLGVPPMGALDALAPPMLDVFTSTPDYGPFVHLPRRIPEAFNTAAAAFSAESLEMDFSAPDRAPRLGELLFRLRLGRQPAPPPGGALPDEDD